MTLGTRAANLLLSEVADAVPHASETYADMTRDLAEKMPNVPPALDHQAKLRLEFEFICYGACAVLLGSRSYFTRRRFLVFPWADVEGRTQFAHAFLQRLEEYADQRGMTELSERQAALRPAESPRIRLTDSEARLNLTDRVLEYLRLLETSLEAGLQRFTVRVGMGVVSTPRAYLHLNTLASEFAPEIVRTAKLVLDATFAE